MTIAPSSRRAFATPVANEGIGASDGEHILLADDEAAIARAVTELLRDPARAEALGKAARAFVQANWTWEALFERQEKVLAEIASR